MLIDQVKAAAFKVQLVRQITEGNSLDVFICVRSLIEHRALVVWLPREIGVSLNALGGELKAGNPLPLNAEGIEQPLANFLTVHAKGTKEEQRSWVIREHGGVRTAWLNLSRIVKSAFPEGDRMRKLYDLASAAIHGRSGRGSDLVLDASRATLQARRLRHGKSIKSLRGHHHLHPSVLGRERVGGVLQPLLARAARRTAASPFDAVSRRSVRAAAV
jgi:hypothetical protein